MNPVLLIFTQIAIAGCGFLVYFLFALRRESKRLRKESRVEIRPMSTQARRGQVVQLYAVERVATRKMRGAASR
jgi:threonine/homoserine/homoserine lactone efflux protein